MLPPFLAAPLLALACSSLPAEAHAEAPAVARAAARVVAPRPALQVESAPLLGGKPQSRALLVALHGGSWTGLGPRQLAERLLAELDGEARRAGLRLIVPIAPEQRSEDEWQVPWLRPAGEAAVLRVIADEVEARRVDLRRVLLAGHGAGATGALQLAARHPELFAGVAAWSGAPSPLWDAERRVVGLVDDPVAGLAEVAVYLWTGSDDEHLDRAALDLLTTGLRGQRAGGRGRPLRIETGEGGHGYGPGPRAGLRFLAEQRKPSPR